MREVNPMKNKQRNLGMQEEREKLGPEEGRKARFYRCKPWRLN